jgi:ABC-2 type transport system permease protein
MINFEFKKYFSKKITFVFSFFIIFSVFISGLILESGLESSPRDEYWRGELNDAILNIDHDLNFNNSQLNENQIESLIAKREIFQYRLDHDIQPYKDKSASNFIIYVNNIFIVIFIFSMIVSTKIITDEYSSGTIKFLLSTGLKRWKYLLSKIIVIFTVPFIFMIIMFITSIIVGWLLFGFDNFSTPYISYNNGNVTNTSVLYHGLIQIMYNSVSIIVGSTVAVFLGVVFKNGHISSLSSVLLAIFGTNIALNFTHYKWVKYTLFANIDFYKFYNESVNTDPFFSLNILGLYCVVLLLVSFLIFSRQEVKL